MSPAFRADAVHGSPRNRDLEFKAAYYKCTQHDWKSADWNGRAIPPGPATAQPLLKSVQNKGYVPLDQRRPSTPVRIGRQVVQAFTTLLFGYDRSPKLRDNDPVTQDFAEALVKESHAIQALVRARNIGGSMGSSVMSWRFANGKPRVSVHSGDQVYVHEWADREELVPSHIVQLYQFPKDEFDPKSGKVVRRMFWYRHDWTERADVAFHPVPVERENPSWTIDEENTNVHEDGFAHVVWVQNLPPDDDGIVDGECDYADVYEAMDSVDIANSVLMKGLVLNLDPTLVLRMELAQVQQGVRKGSDNAIVTGLQGDAKYMELAGTSITVGEATIAKQISRVLDSVQCVLVDPNVVAASGTSSVAIKAIYAPMLAKGSVLRDQYGRALERLVEQMVASAKRRYDACDVEIITEVQTEVDEAGNEVEVEVQVEQPVRWTLSLPPRVETAPVLDAEGQPTGEETTRLVEREPGTGGDLWVEWGDWFQATPLDKQAVVQTLSTATGAKAVISQRSAVKVIAELYGFDPDAEFKDVLSDDAAAREAMQGGMFPGVGGEVEPLGLEEGNAGAEDGGALSREVDPDGDGLAGEPASAAEREALAAKMTSAGIERCEHGANNRCRLCGIERVRDFETMPDGQVRWLILWRAM
jgi:hypothetical protein